MVGNIGPLDVAQFNGPQSEKVFAMRRSEAVGSRH
jgi:hypothetical protein